MRLLLRCTPLWWAMLVLTIGCQTGVVAPDVTESIRAASGVENAVEFRANAEPLDASADMAGGLTLGGAVRLALRHDPGLQAALARVRSAQADAQQARLLPNPVLSVALRFTESGAGKPVIEAGLAADLLAVLQQPRRASAADARLRAASAQALTVALDLLLDVQNTYVAVQALDAELNVLAQRTALIDRLLSMAKSRVQLGESSQLDVLTLDSERLSLNVEVSEKASDLRQQRLQMARLIGEPGGRIDWPLDALSRATVAPREEASLISAAMEHRPEVQAQLWELAAWGDDAAIARWAVFDGTDIGVDAERDGDWTIGPAITTPLPMFDWGQARSDKATAAVIQARHQLLQTRRQIVQEVRQTFESLVSSEQALRAVQDELIPLQQRRIEQAEAAYKNGLADITAVLIAEQESQASRQKLIELQQKVAVAEYRLHRAVGGSAVMPSTTPLSTQPSTQPGTQPPSRGES